MRDEINGIATGAVAADISLIAETHWLSRSERERLLRSVTGAIPGNRDRPVFLLAKGMLETGAEDPFDLIVPGESGLPRFDAALLDFLITVAVDAPAEGMEVVAAIATALTAPDQVRELASCLARVLHGYRKRALPDARRHNVFTAIRRFYTRYRGDDPLPRDEDALDLWQAEATRAFLTRYSTALTGLADYAEAAQLAASWKRSVELDAGTTREMPVDAEVEEAADDPLGAEALSLSLEVLDTAPIKLLLARELDALAALAAVGGIVRRWPLASLALLGYGPVQNAIAQEIRREAGTPDVDAHLARAQGYLQLRDQHALLSEKLLDCLHLVRLAGLPKAERPSARSTLGSDRRKRIEAMQRRQSYAEREESVRKHELASLVEPLVTLRTFLETVCGIWNRLPADRLREVQFGHAAVFEEKLWALYGAKREGRIG